MVLCASRLHVWMKFGGDWSKTTTCIATQTDKFRNRVTDKQTNRQTNILANFFEILASKNPTLASATVLLFAFYTKTETKYTNFHNENIIVNDAWKIPPYHLTLECEWKKWCHYTWCVAHYVVIYLASCKWQRFVLTLRDLNRRYHKYTIFNLATWHSV